ncbi:hypothetical protein ACQEVX_05240 [Streptomyces syringium]|uniref:hypothetical protein n=1 Tax=Streptomyces syringium TaxID=76729 RepID=UPI003D8E6CA2
MIHPMAGLTATKTYLYLATDLEERRVRRDPTEAGMAMECVRLEAAVKRVAGGTISEAGSALGILLAARTLTP